MERLEILKRYKAGYYKVPRLENRPRMVSMDHIFDENLSVKENRRLAEEHNDNVKKIRRELQEAENKKTLELRGDITQYIMEEYGLSQKVAEVAEAKAWEDGHWDVWDYFQKADEYAEFAGQVCSAQ